MLKDAICFDDVLLEPKFSDITSRKEIVLESHLCDNILLNLPVISSPMDTVTEFQMALSMSKSGGIGILHRYNSIEYQCEMVRASINCGATSVGAAIGVSGDYIERARSLVRAGANVLCVDIAHGHHALMRHALKTLRNTLGYDIHIMAGNVATLDGFNDLSDWGANSVRVGIGGGSICSTRVQTGHGVPTLQSVLDCSQSDRPASLIADGGIRNSGDVVKALAAGADFVMLGSILSGTDETPGEIAFVSGERYKAYRGMASKDAQIDWRGHTASIEGVSSVVPLKGPVEYVLKELETGIRSGLSYTGAKNIRELQAKCTFIRQTGAGVEESSTHIRNKGIT
jgi:IMP dehydrogenase